MGARSDEELEEYMRQVVIGPLESPDVQIVDYDAAWPERFAAESARIHAALGGRERSIEHIGSTSVPGLAAKPIIDILLIVDDPADEGSYLPALESSGYELRVREPDFFQHRMLRTPRRDVHVHVFPPGSPEVERYRLLRDRLRRDEGDRRLYEQTKRRLAARSWPTMEHYAAAKTEVIEAIIARAIADAGGDGGARP